MILLKLLVTTEKLIVMNMGGVLTHFARSQILHFAKATEFLIQQKKFEVSNCKA